MLTAGITKAKLMGYLNVRRIGEVSKHYGVMNETRHPSSLLALCPSGSFVPCYYLPDAGIILSLLDLIVLMTKRMESANGVLAVPAA